MKHIEHKPPSGKLLKVDATVERNVIKSIKITGDFFMHPEEAITLLEETLAGAPLDSDVLSDKLNTLCSKLNIHLIGLTVNDIVETLVKLKDEC